MSPSSSETLKQYTAVAFGGVLGALLREALEVALPPLSGSGFPIATLIINLTGSFLLAWFYTVTIWRFHAPQWLRVGIGSGLIGSYTTFSTFMVEANSLFSKGHWIPASLYVALSIVGGLAMAWAGARLAGERKEDSMIEERSEAATRQKNAGLAYEKRR